MISIPVSATVSGGTAPYTFTFSSTVSSVTFSTVTGEAELSGGVYTASTDVLYPTQAAIETAFISVTFVDANGCSTTINPLTVANPCTMQTSISSNGDFVFVATTTGGSGNYIYDWNYDTGLFSKASGDTDDEDNYLSLKLNTGVTIPTSTPVSVLVTDVKGCTKSASFTYNFCQPRAASTTVALVCDSTPVAGCSTPVSQYRNLDLTRLVDPCAGQELDWTTLELSLPSGVCITDDNAGMITIASNLTSSQTKSFNYFVRTTSGIRSTVGTIVVTIPSCTASKSFNAVPTTIQLTIEDVVSDVKLIPVEPRVAGTPNWSTFTFTNTPSWGTVTFNADREIEYEITDVTTTPTVPDIIQWTLNDTSGGQVNITDTVLRDRIAAPVTVLDVVCNSCGETTEPIDVLANDTGDIDRSTLFISDGDPEIIVVKDSDNNFIFTSLPGATFNNFLNYRVANTQGVFSTDAIRINVQVACVGDNNAPVADLTCEVAKTINIADQFTNTNAFGLTFAETTTTTPTYTTQGGTISGGGDLDFTAIATDRVYTFEMTAQNVVACSPDFDDVGELIVIHGASPSISITSAVDNGNGTSTYEWSYVNLVGPYYITLNGVVPSYQSSPLASGGSGTLTLYNVAGVNTLIIQSANVCGGTTSDTDNSITV